MSHSDKPVSELGLDSLSNRFRDSLGCDANKPDSRELDLGSPISPLRTSHHHSAAPATSSGSSSGSSGSVTGRTGHNPVVKRSDSGEQSGSSENNSPTAAGNVSRSFKPGSRSDSGTSQPLIYSGQTQRSPSSSSSTSAVNSPPLNVLPTGNICPSGRVLKTGMAASASRSSRSDVLGSGMGNYGHGSIMRGGKGGGGGGAGEGAAANARVSGSEGVKRGVGSVDPEEVKRAGNEQYKKGNFAEALCLYDRAIALSPASAAYRSNRAAALTGLGRLGEAVRECEEAVRLDPDYGRAHQRLATLFLR